jgi:hypothetical protein
MLLEKGKHLLGIRGRQCSDARTHDCPQLISLTTARPSEHLGQVVQHDFGVPASQRRPVRHGVVQLGQQPAYRGGAAGTEHARRFSVTAYGTNLVDERVADGRPAAANEHSTKLGSIHLAAFDQGCGQGRDVETRLHRVADGEGSNAHVRVGHRYGHALAVAGGNRGHETELVLGGTASR